MYSTDIHEGMQHVANSCIRFYEINNTDAALAIGRLVTPADGVVRIIVFSLNL